MNRTIVISAVVVIGVYLVAQTIADRTAAESVDEAIASLPDGIEVTYGDSSVSLVGMSLHLEDVVVRPNQEGAAGFGIDELILNDIDRDHDIPNWVDIEMRGVSGVAEEFLTRAGFAEDAKPDFALEYRYDTEEGRLQVNSISANLAGAGELSFSMDIGNFKLTAESLQNPAMLLPFAQLNSLRIQFDDDSLMQRMVDAAAKEDSTTPELVRAGLLAQIDGVLAVASDDLSREALTATRKFVEKPSYIALNIKPESPVAIASLATMQPAQIISALNIHVE